MIISSWLSVMHFQNGLKSLQQRRQQPLQPSNSLKKPSHGLVFLKSSFLIMEHNLSAISFKCFASRWASVISELHHITHSRIDKLNDSLIHSKEDFRKSNMGIQHKPQSKYSDFLSNISFNTKQNNKFDVSTRNAHW